MTARLLALSDQIKELFYFFKSYAKSLCPFDKEQYVNGVAVVEPVSAGSTDCWLNNSPSFIITDS